MEKVLQRELARMYERGYTIRQIARRYNYSYGAVHKSLKSENVEMRPRGSRGNGK